MDSSSTYIGYWPIRGLGAHLRHVMAATGKTDFTYVTYTNRDDWAAEKNRQIEAGFPTSTLPYLVHNGVVYTEHEVCSMAAAKLFKPELLGTTEKDQANVQAFMSGFAKSSLKYVPWNRKSQPDQVVTEEDRIAGFSVFNDMYTKADKHLASNKFLGGAGVSVADCYLWE